MSAPRRFIRYDLAPELLADIREYRAGTLSETSRALLSYMLRQARQEGADQLHIVDRTVADDPANWFIYGAVEPLVIDVAAEVLARDAPKD
jgi:hypothetical protein